MHGASPPPAPALKFCGITRADDARHAAGVGAAYIGCIFAGGPRLVTAEQASALATAMPDAAVQTVGVMGDVPARAAANLAHAAGLGVVQLHADPDARAVATMRRHWDGPVWAVVRVRGDQLPPHTESLFDVADAVVLDAHVPGGMLGGNGVTLPWQALADALAPLRGRAPLVLAGGLRPENVGAAVAALAPDVVDVSSGVERTPGVKDHTRMTAFAAAARQLVVL
ncbi:N-(5'-phosphoribosyl)anthranilate isomerase [Gemmatimonadetes bacterium T265]|nr:N-(5'-phosphoribosyl)anthranilate isomerase [Gemmatimonadetes bacterium T265]